MRPLSRRGADPTAQRQNRRPPAGGPAGSGSRRRSNEVDGSQQRAGAPWHFWLVVVMAAAYLGWRATEGVVWLIQWLGGAVG